MTMLEKMSLAMIEAMPAFVGEKNTPDQPDTFCSYVDCQDVDFANIARAALMAIREPSEAMTAVGMTGVLQRSPRVTWVLMIDAILADAPPCPSAPGSVE